MERKTTPRGTMVEVQCYCGKAFQARKADRDRGWGRFCSKACKANYVPPPPAPVLEDPSTLFSAKADAALTTVRIISDPDAEFWRLLIELSNAIKITYGREAEVTIWPKGIPIGAMMPVVVGTYAGMRIVGPATAVARLSRKGA